MKKIIIIVYFIPTIIFSQIPDPEFVINDLKDRIIPNLMQIVPNVKTDRKNNQIVIDLKKLQIMRDKHILSLPFWHSTSGEYEKILKAIFQDLPYRINTNSETTFVAYHYDLNDIKITFYKNFDHFTLIELKSEKIDNAKIKFIPDVSRETEQNVKKLTKKQEIKYFYKNKRLKFIYIAGYI